MTGLLFWACDEAAHHGRGMCDKAEVFSSWPGSGKEEEEKLG